MLLICNNSTVLESGGRFVSQTPETTMIGTGGTPVSTVNCQGGVQLLQLPMLSPALTRQKYVSSFNPLATVYAVPGPVVSTTGLLNCRFVIHLHLVLRCST